MISGLQNDIVHNQSRPRPQRRSEDFGPSLDKAARQDAQRERDWERDDDPRGQEYGLAAYHPREALERSVTQRVVQTGREDAGAAQGASASRHAAEPAQRPTAAPEAVKSPAAVAAGDKAAPTEITMRDVAQLSVKVETAAGSAEAPVVDAALRLWADRLGSTEQTPAASEAAPEAALDGQVEVDVAIEADPEEDGSEPSAEADSEMSMGDFGKGSNASTGGKSGGGEFSSRQQGFEISARAADVNIKDGGSVAARTRLGEVTQTVKEMARARVQSNAVTGKSAEVELSIDGERVVVKVSVKGGRVDVDIRGLEAGEMARLRQELRPELERMALELGDVKDEDDVAGDGQGRGRNDQPQSEAPQEVAFDLSAFLEGADAADEEQVWGGQ
jgi:hypothetical protein